MKKRVLPMGLLLLFVITSIAYAGTNPTYKTVQGDPMQARIYTLSNGLKVYLSVNKLQPRIQTYIAVKVGSKNDPHETTGLSHYFEHLLFKGTSHFGTSNYALEKPLLDQIRSLYEVYRHTTDAAQKKVIYHQIDSISYEASKYSIANEYDKLMTSIGAQNIGAFTNVDRTEFLEDIPSNQIENWAKIESERFSNAVIRGFHTELEAVYEEYNMYLNNDIDKIRDAINKGLFPNHPYGMQTIIGTQENLKNPSIVNIDNHYHNFYVPNNMAICMSGDLDPDQTIAIIEKYFGGMKPKPDIKKLDPVTLPAINQPITAKVMGPEAPKLAIAWRFPAENSLATDTLQLVDMILGNGQAGLLDEDINQQQKLLGFKNQLYTMGDFSFYSIIGAPKEGQTMDDVKNIFLAEINKLKRGEFSEDLLKGSINQFKLKKMNDLGNNKDRATMFVESFIKDIPWENQVNSINRLSKITKADIIAFANRYFKDNYVAVYKEQGENPNEKKIDKPSITPILTNRDKSSDFLREIQNSTVKPIEPVFVDFQKDMTIGKAKSGIQLFYKKNTMNDLFTIVYHINRGSNNDRYLDYAIGYLDWLGTNKMSHTAFSKKMYNLGCSFKISAGNNYAYIIVNGLSENMKAAMNLVEDLMSNAVVDKAAFKPYIKDIIKIRIDDKLNQQSNFDNLVNYVTYGGQYQKKALSDQELLKINPQTLVDKIHQFFTVQHLAFYYGPMDIKDVVQVINQTHRIPKVLKPLPKEVEINKVPTTDNIVFIAPYNAKTIMVDKLSVSNKKFSLDIEPARTLYNCYFGETMNGILFQELREARALAYSVQATYGEIYKKNDTYMMNALIITQNDKAKEALAAYQNILDNMPAEQANFDMTKQNLLSFYRSKRTTGIEVIEYYINSQLLGLNYDRNKTLFEKVQNMTINDLLNFQKNYIKGIKYHTVILGNEKDLDMNAIAKYGKIVRLSQKDIFGY